MITCQNCFDDKEDWQFHKSPQSPNGRTLFCAQCIKNYREEMRQGRGPTTPKNPNAHRLELELEVADALACQDILMVREELGLPPPEWAETGQA